MNIRHRIITLLLLAAAAVPPLRAQAFADKGFHPRAEALGRAVTALTEDAAALFYNPAAIGFETSGNAYAGYSNLYPEVTGGGMNLFNAGAAYSLGALGTAGVAVSHFAPAGWSEQTIAASFATRMFMEDLSVGGTFKLLHWGADAPQGANAVPEPALSYTGFTVDIGASYLLRDIAEENDLVVAASILNLTQPSVSSSGSADAALPMALNAGGRFVSRKYDYSILADVTLEDGELSFAFGGELTALRSQMLGASGEFVVRAGGGRAVKGDVQGDYNGGFGIRVEGFTLDYSYKYQALMRNVGGISSVSVGYEW